MRPTIRELREMLAAPGATPNSSFGPIDKRGSNSGRKGRARLGPFNPKMSPAIKPVRYTKHYSNNG